MTKSSPMPPLPCPTAWHLFTRARHKIGRWGQSQRVSGLTGEANAALFARVIEPLMEDYAKHYVAAATGDLEKKAEKGLAEAAQLNDRVKYFDEFACPTCKEPRHPKSAVCWRCAHDGMRKSYSANTEAFEKLRQHVRAQRAIVQLAVNVLGRSARQKKKGPFVRQARAILEAALAEPEPGDPPMSLLTKLGIGGITAMAGMLAYGLFGNRAYGQSKANVWGSVAHAGPPPTAEELAASP